MSELQDDPGHRAPAHASMAHRRRRRLAAVTLILCGVAVVLVAALVYVTRGPSAEDLLQRAQMTDDPCGMEIDSFELGTGDFRRIDRVLETRCAERRCLLLRDSLVSGDIDAARSVLRSAGADGTGPNWLLSTCTVGPPAVAALDAADEIRGNAAAIPPRWHEAWETLHRMPTIPGVPRTALVPDDLAQRVVAGCFQDARRASDRALSEGDWETAASMANEAHECGRAMTAAGPDTSTLAELRATTQAAELCQIATRVERAKYWKDAVPLLESLGEAPGADRLPRGDAATVSRALRRARAGQEQEERRQAQAERRCDYADRRADRCEEICTYRDRGDGRCFDMCERRYPGCRRNNDSDEEREPVLDSLSLQFCEPARYDDRRVAGTMRAASREGSRDRVGPRGQEPDQEEVGADDFE